MIRFLPLSAAQTSPLSVIFEIVHFPDTIFLKKSILWNTSFGPCTQGCNKKHEFLKLSIYIFEPSFLKGADI